MIKKMDQLNFELFDDTAIYIGIIETIVDLII